MHAQTQTGDTALAYACENGHTDVAEVLLMYGAELEHESEGARTPLMKACRAGHLCTVKFLISRGASVNRQTSNNDHTPLSLACAGGHLAVVELLLASNADPFHKLKDNSTMLIEAAKGGHITVVQLLLDFPQSLSNEQLLMNNSQTTQFKSSNANVALTAPPGLTESMLVSSHLQNQMNSLEENNPSDLISYNDYLKSNPNYTVDTSASFHSDCENKEENSILAQMRLLQINDDGFKDGFMQGLQINQQENQQEVPILMQTLSNNCQQQVKHSTNSLGKKAEERIILCDSINKNIDPKLLRDSDTGYDVKPDGLESCGNDRNFEEHIEKKQV